MKEIDHHRELKRSVKADAVPRGWRYIDGSPYWTLGPLFFTNVLSTNFKHGTFYTYLRFKWLELDHMMWDVLGLGPRYRKPFSLHANGIFCLFGQEIDSSAARGIDWLPSVLDEHVRRSSDVAAAKSAEVAGQIDSIYAYRDFIRRGQEALMQRAPNAATNIWKEEVLISLLVRDVDSAVRVAKERIAAGDLGGYGMGQRTFYHQALAFSGRYCLGTTSALAPN